MATSDDLAPASPPSSRPRRAPHLHARRGGLLHCWCRGGARGAKFCLRARPGGGATTRRNSLTRRPTNPHAGGPRPRGGRSHEQRDAPDPEVMRLAALRARRGWQARGRRRAVVWRGATCSTSCRATGRGNALVFDGLRVHTQQGVRAETPPPAASLAADPTTRARWRCRLSACWSRPARVCGGVARAPRGPLRPLDGRPPRRGPRPGVGSALLRAAVDDPHLHVRDAASPRPSRSSKTPHRAFEATPSTASAGHRRRGAVHGGGERARRRCPTRPPPRAHPHGPAEPERADERAARPTVSTVFTAWAGGLTPPARTTRPPARERDHRGAGPEPDDERRAASMACAGVRVSPLRSPAGPASLTTATSAAARVPGGEWAKGARSRRRGRRRRGDGGREARGDGHLSWSRSARAAATARSGAGDVLHGEREVGAGNDDDGVLRVVVDDGGRRRRFRRRAVDVRAGGCPASSAARKVSP